MTRLTLRFCMALLCCSHLPLAAQVQYTKEREDLIRFGRYHKAYDQRMALTNEGNGYTTVFPIPQKSIELNPNLKQNKGYADKEL